MKKLICFFLLATALQENTGAQTGMTESSKPSAYFKKMWVDYDVTENGKLGMRMHVSFSVYDMKGVPGGLSCFIKFADGDPDSYIIHKEKAGDAYHTKSGYLRASTTIRPTADIMNYDDLEVFMPYEEIDLEPGEYDLSIDVILQSFTENIAYLKMYDFTFTEAGTSRSAPQSGDRGLWKPFNQNGPNARFDSLWVEFNVKESEQLGMRIHFKFATFNMKDTAASVAVYFLYNNIEGGTLKDKNNQYGSASGDVAAYADIKPGFDTAYFNDLSLFMPYSELHLAAGNYQLLMDSKLIYRRGGLIANFLHYGFKFTQN